MTLDEHLMIYLTSVPTLPGSCNVSRPATQTTTGSKTPTNSTRFQIEERVINFLYSLRYYSQRQLRAKTFAMMLGFMKEEKLRPSKERQREFESANHLERADDQSVLSDKSKKDHGLPYNKTVTF